MISGEKGEKNEPDNFKLAIVLKACAGLQLLKQGKILHGFWKKNETTGLDLFVGSALIEFYSKCGEMGDVLNLFKEFEKPDVVLWTSMVSGYEQNGCFEKAVTFFSRMVVEEGVDPDRVTLVSLVSACAKLMNLKLGRSAHGFVIRRGFENDLSLVNAFLNLYAKTALHLFNEMINKGYQPNAVTVVSALQACVVARDLDEGQRIHELATKRAVNVFRKMRGKDVVSWVALLSGYSQNGMAYKSIGIFRDMLSSGIQPDAVSMVKVLASSSELELYSKCGSIDYAIKVFEGIIDKDVVLWSAMIAGYGIHGQGGESLNHAGLLLKGIEIFHMTVNDYGLNPGSEHYGMVVDLLGRTGELDKAMDIINRMPIPVEPQVWGYYILLSNMYAVDGKWGNVAKVRTLIKEKGLKKMFGQGMDEIRNEVHSFVADDKLHEECEKIYELLGQLEVIMRLQLENIYEISGAPSNFKIT
ncbi:hypothetical protein CRYUN_Cryun17cG0030600 [Craigia yunnanensis]